METYSGGQATTTTTVSETQVQTNLRFDPSYIRTVPGMLKLAALVRLSLHVVVFGQQSVHDWFTDPQHHLFHLHPIGRGLHEGPPQRRVGHLRIHVCLLGHGNTDHLLLGKTRRDCKHFDYFAVSPDNWEIAIYLSVALPPSAARGVTHDNCNKTPKTSKTCTTWVTHWNGFFFATVSDQGLHHTLKERNKTCGALKTSLKDDAFL